MHDLTNEIIELILRTSSSLRASIENEEPGSAARGAGDHSQKHGTVAGQLHADLPGAEFFGRHDGLSWAEQIFPAG